jgi:hypothetical protein
MALNRFDFAARVAGEALEATTALALKPRLEL